MSARPLRVILVEDSVDDARLLEREIRRGGYDPLTLRRVESERELLATLDGEAQWDLLITDYSLPTFSGPAALAAVRRSGRDLPVIMISGTVNEELAVESLKSGASDFISKGRLTRLLPAIERELRELGSRRERVSAVTALRESERRYRLLFEASPLPTVLFLVDSLAFVGVNETALRFYGYGREEMLGLGLDAVWPDAEADARVRVLRETRGIVQLTGVKHRRRDGSIVEVDVSSHEVTVGGREARLAVCNDVTERRALEAQLRQAQKMEAFGQLAGGIAHDFNNMLAAITSYAELAIEQLEEGSTIRADIEEIRSAAFRAGALTRQLLAFSRQQPQSFELCDLSVVATRIEGMLRRTIGEDVELLMHLATGLGRVRADPGQIEQVLLNLIVNARDAMPDGGTITVSTFNASLAEADAARMPDLEPGELIALSVRDTGTGMDDATKARIFEPFFTTKPVGKGTGLGLATVYGIVKQTGGHIEVDSAPGVGTTFTVFFPRSDDDDPPASQRKRPSTRPRGSETVLLVEDDGALRKVTARILCAAGYSVLEAANAHEARDLWAQHASPIALLLTDVVMPQTSGPALAATLTRERPGTRVLYMSGYAEARSSANRVPEGAAVLEKPFNPAALRRRVREVLDDASPSR